MISPMTTSAGKENSKDIEALIKKMEAFNEVAEQLQRSYDELQVRIKKLDLELEDKNKELVEKYAFTICLLPLKDIIKSVKILWSRQDDGKRLTGIKTQKEYQSYLKERMTGYIESADLVVYTHHASIKKIVSKISFSFNKLGILKN